MKHTEPVERLPIPPTTVDADGNTLRWLDTVESTSRPGHRATVGAVFADGTFDVCDIDIGLFGRQQPRQWRKVSDERRQ